MALPKSTKFDLFDWNIRSGTTTYADDRTLSDESDPITEFSTIPFDNVVVEQGFATLVADTANYDSTNKLEKAYIRYDDFEAGVPTSFTFEFDISLHAPVETGLEIDLVEGLPVETKIYQEFIPKDFADVNHRIFVGVVDQQLHTAGFVFSYQGIGLARYPEDPDVIPLGGSYAYIFNDDGTPRDSVTIRAVVDGEDNRLAIYIGDTAAVYLENSDLADIPLVYNMAAPISANVLGDSLFVQASAPSKASQKVAKEGTPLAEIPRMCSSLTVSSLRLSGTKVLPEDKPISVVGAKPFSLVTDVVKLDGSNSYDLSGKYLSYHWEVEARPDASTSLLQGSKSSYVVFGEENADNRILFLALNPSEYMNGFTVDVVAAEPDKTVIATTDVGEPLYKGAVLSMELVGDSKLIVYLAVDGEGNVTTRARDFIAAFNSPMAAGYNIKVTGGDTYEFIEQASGEDALDEEGNVVVPGVTSGADVPKKISHKPKFNAVLLYPEEGTGEGIISPGKFILAGGAGSVLMNPVFVPDVPGPYLFSLSVNNGNRSSDKSFVTVTATIDEHLLEHRPNSTYVWQHLPDFWNLVHGDGKDQITSLWSSATQVIAGELLSTWQHDYAKAIKDVTRKFQRKWLSHSVSQEVETSLVTLEYPTPSGEVTVNVNPVHPEVGILSKFAKWASVEATSEIPLGPVLYKTSLGSPNVIKIVGIESTTDASLSLVGTPKKFTTKGKALKVMRLIASRTAGSFVKDPANVAFLAKSRIFRFINYASASISIGDYIRVYGETTFLARVDEINPGAIENSVRLADIDEQPVTGTPYNWEHLVKSAMNQVKVSPYFLFADTLDLSSYELGLGDYAKLLVVDPYTGDDIDVIVPIVAFGERCLFVGWQTLLDTLNLAAALYPDVVEGTTDTWTIEKLAELDISLKHVCAPKKLPKQQDLVSCPKLGTSLNALYDEGLDYQVIDQRIVFKDFVVGTFTVKKDSTEVAVIPELYHPRITPSEMTADSLKELGVNSLTLTTGTTGNYEVVAVEVSLDKSITLHLKTPMTVSGTFEGYLPRYSAFYPSQDLFWAEMSYFDNWKTIEGNFGLYVGLPKEVLESYTTTADYLSVTKSLWFAFFSGPHFTNLELAAQAFYSLPFTEEAGQVGQIDEATPTKQGRIALLVGNIIKNYYFPYGATIAVNPLTGSTITATAYRSEEEIDATEMSDELKAAEKVLLNNSKVPAYTKLVNVVSIQDYISDELLISKTLIDEGVIRKYHTFIVDVPLNITRTTGVFPLIKAYLQEARPAYTDFILVGSISLSDSVDAIDEQFMFPTMTLVDTPHTSPFFAQKDAVGEFNKAMVPSDKEALLWPKHSTLAKNIGSFKTLTTVHTGDPITPPPGVIAWPSGNTLFQIYGEATQQSFSTGDVIFIQDNYQFEGDGFTAIVEQTASFELQITFVVPIQTWTFYFLKLKDPVSGEIILYEEYGRVPLNVESDFVFPIYGTVSDKGFFDQDDVKEKYESGFAEGILDNYSGDGSWNMEKSILDMVNTTDNDIDVIGSKLWLPVVLSNDATLPGFTESTEAEKQDDLEFVKGEEVSFWYRHNITNDWAKVPDHIWDESPPLIEHIGAGNHPKIPHSFSPQNTHPYSYLVLGFENQNFSAKNDYGDELRLQPKLASKLSLETLSIGQVGLWGIVGLTSGKLAVLDALMKEDGVQNQNFAFFSPNLPGFETGKESYTEFQSLNDMVAPRLVPPLAEITENTSLTVTAGYDEAEQRYFQLSHLWDEDKLVENNPHFSTTLTMTQYVPTYGTSFSNFWASAPAFDMSQWTSLQGGGGGGGGGGMGPPAFNPEKGYGWQVQQHPYNSKVTPSHQFVPSFGPGLGPQGTLTDPNSQLVCWGYAGSSVTNTDVRVATEPTVISDFELGISFPHSGMTDQQIYESPALKNLHIGVRINTWREKHFTHGFVEFTIPKPEVNLILPLTAGDDIRICGSYLCNDDPTRVAIPTLDPNSYGDPANGEGMLGGSWVFFRNVFSGSETPVVAINFETGVHPTKVIAEGAGKMIYGLTSYNVDGVATQVAQPSDGHILEVDIPELPTEGYYDIIIRNYRPYQFKTGSAWAYHMDEIVISKAYYFAPGGFGGITWGTGAFGGGDD
jgi:hypothetical protein